MPDTPPQPPQPGQLVRFTTKAQGQIIGAYFHGLYYAAAPNECWSDAHVTEWVPVVPVPCDAATTEAQVRALINHRLYPLGLSVAEARRWAEHTVAVVMAAVPGAGGG